MKQRRLGYTAGFGPELVPFIEAHARLGDWPGALELSRQAQASISEMEPLLCSTWARLAQSEALEGASLQAAQDAFDCRGT